MPNTPRKRRSPATPRKSTKRGEISSYKDLLPAQPKRPGRLAYASEDSQRFAEMQDSMASDLTVEKILSAPATRELRVLTRSPAIAVICELDGSTWVTSTRHNNAEAFAFRQHIEADPRLDALLRLAFEMSEDDDREVFAVVSD